MPIRAFSNTRLDATFYKSYRAYNLICDLHCSSCRFFDQDKGQRKTTSFSSSRASDLAVAPPTTSKASQILQPFEQFQSMPSSQDPTEPYNVRWGLISTGGIVTRFTNDLLLPPAE
jgi:hypothetical protein